MKSITVEYGQTIFDIALIAYGDASKAYDLINENPDKIENINSDLTGLELVYTPTAPLKKEAVMISKPSNKVVTMQSSQTLLDLALQYYGAPEEVIRLIKENPEIDGLHDQNYIGKVLNYNLSSASACRFYREKGTDVATRFPYFETYGTNFLKQENGYYLLQENGDRILLE